MEQAEEKTEEAEDTGDDGREQGQDSGRGSHLLILEGGWKGEDGKSYVEDTEPRVDVLGEGEVDKLDEGEAVEEVVANEFPVS